MFQSTRHCRGMWTRGTIVDTVSTRLTVWLWDFVFVNSVVDSRQTDDGIMERSGGWWLIQFGRNCIFLCSLYQIYKNAPIGSSEQACYPTSKMQPSTKDIYNSSTAKLVGKYQLTAATRVIFCISPFCSRLPTIIKAGCSGDHQEEEFNTSLGLRVKI